MLVYIRPTENLKFSCGDHVQNEAIWNDFKIKIKTSLLI